ncbi:hypothetical protein BH11PSE9_BH11PSE9_17520 [soil metagenome]
MNAPLRLACSNIAWPDDQDAEALACLERHGVSGIEVAPTRLWPCWHGASLSAARRHAAEFAACGLALPSMQALLFDQPNAQLFGPDGGRAFEQHLGFVAGLGAGLGATAAVLGAPRNRQRGSLDAAAATGLAVPILRRLAAVYADHGLVLALEPARPEYGGDFVTTTFEALALVQAVDHPGLGLHLDAAALHAAGERIEDVWAACAGISARPVHYQLSEPALGGFEAPQAPQLHNLRFLQQQAWSGWCAIEMRSQANGLERSGPWALLEALRDGG